MAATGTPTPNLGLRRAQGTDPASVDDINYNSELLDTKLGAVGATSVQGQIDALSASTAQTFGNVQDGLAIVSNGNTHVAIPAGYWVYVKGHGTLSEGLYKNTSGATIAANATLSTSNLTADPDGGLNSVYSALNSKLGNAHIYSRQDNTTSYTFTLDPFTENKYKAGLLIQHDAWNPSIYIVSMRGGATPTDIFAYPVFTRTGSLTITSISVTNKVLSVTYSTTAYGGCTLLWFN